MKDLLFHIQLMVFAVHFVSLLMVLAGVGAPYARTVMNYAFYPNAMLFLAIMFLK